VPNTELKLKPGMTANVKIEIARRSNALRVPNAALRFRPTQEIFTALNQTPPPEATGFANAGRAGRSGRGAGGAPDAAMQPPAAGNATASAPAAAVAPAPSQRPAGSASSSAEPSARAERGRGGFGSGGVDGNGDRGPRANGGWGADRGGRGGDPAQFQARMVERFKSMSPDEQTQFIARMKERGVDTSAFEQAKPAGPAKKPGAPATANAQGARTIDALFAPLPPVESRARAWLYIDRQLKPVNLRLGITDGTYTELLGGELQETSELVTGVTGLGPTRSTVTPGGTGNPLMPGRGPGGPGGGRGPR
jgi:HlyD family secretion protein